MDKQTLIKRAKELSQNYKPSQEVKDCLSKLELITVVGPTGVGKSTIIDKSGLPFVLSDMTREPREGERDGVDVNFRTDYGGLADELAKGKFVQYLVGHTGEFYGTKISSYPERGVCAMPVLASVIPLFRTYGFKRVVPIYIVPPNFDEWMRRTGLHHDKDIKERMVEAKESLGMALADPTYYFIINQDLGASVRQLQQLASGTLPASTELERARNIATDLLAHLNSAY